MKNSLLSQWTAFPCSGSIRVSSRCVQICMCVYFICMPIGDSENFWVPLDYSIWRVCMYAGDPRTQYIFL